MATLSSWTNDGLGLAAWTTLVCIALCLWTTLVCGALCPLAVV